MTDRPSVTVVVPLLNASSLLPELMDALQRQTWPSSLTEIILVDNGSTDRTAEIASHFVSAAGSRVRYLTETGSRSPYAARNRGIDAGNGEIFALLDANKIPEPLWLQAGVDALMKQGAGLAGGAIKFRLATDTSTGELADAVMFNNNRELVARDGGSAAGNLFFRRDVWERTGPFPSRFRSGMDIWWTREATKKGFSLIYVPDAVVRCIPRIGMEVVRKGYRVGMVHPHNMYADGESSLSIFSKALRTFSPPRPLGIRSRLSECGVAASTLTTAGVWGFVWMTRMAMAAGRLRGLFGGFTSRRNTDNRGDTGSASDTDPASGTTQGESGKGSASGTEGESGKGAASGTEGGDT